MIKDNKPSHDPGIVGTHITVQLENARFVNVKDGCLYDGGTRVLIKDGKILAVRPPEDNRNEPNPDLVIDLKGKTVLPAFFNVHCHIQTINPTIFSTIKTLKDRKTFRAVQIKKSLADCLDCGVTNIRDAFTDDLSHNRQLKKEITVGDIPGPRIQQSVGVGVLGGYLSPKLNGIKGMLLTLAGIARTSYDDENTGILVFAPDAEESTVRDTVDRAVEERGAEAIKVGESLEKSLLNPNPKLLSTKQLGWIADQARRRGLQSTIHSVSVETFRRAVDAGFSSVAHLPRNNVLNMHDIEACRSAGCIIDPTVSVAYDASWRLPNNCHNDVADLDLVYNIRNRTYRSLAEQFWVPELAKHVISGFEKANKGRYKMLGLINMIPLLEHFSHLPHHGTANLRNLIENGIPISCGNDGGVQSCTPAMAGHELQMLDLILNSKMKKVFSAADIIRTATINSARSMGVEQQFGSIEPGKIADLVVLDGDPFQDPLIIGQPVDALFMDGKLMINKCGLSLTPFQSEFIT